jgi:hypothetical protein
VAFAIFSLLIAVWYTFWSYGGHLLARIASSGDQGFLTISLASVWLYGAIVAINLPDLIKQLLFEHGTAVWVDGERLYYMRGRKRSLLRGDIVDVAQGKMTISYRSVDAIVLRLRDSSHRTFPTVALIESPSVVVDRLKNALNLSDKSDGEAITTGWQRSYALVGDCGLHNPLPPPA